MKFYFIYIIIIVIIIIKLLIGLKYFNKNKLSVYFFLYDIYNLYGNRYKYDLEYASNMKNMFKFNLPIDFYKQFNQLIYPRITNGDNNLNQAKIKSLCNQMLKYSINNKVTNGKSLSLPILDANSSNFNILIKQYISKDIPFVIRNLKLSIFENYTFDSLLKKLEEERVLFSPNIPKCPQKKYGYFSEIKFNNCYLSNITSVFKNHPILNIQDEQILKDLTSGIMDSKQLFVGNNKNSGTRLHCAFTNNIFLNVIGEKKWTFFNPNSTPLLYPYFSKYGIYNTSESRFLSYDDYLSYKDQFPLIQYADRFEYIIQPKEILFNPASWWHSIQNMTKQTFAISTRWEFKKFPSIDYHVLRSGNLNNINLRNLSKSIYYQYGIIGLGLIDEHNIIDESNNNKDENIPLWDKLTNDNHNLCLNNNCSSHWH